MSKTLIGDGTGHGYSVKVDAKNRLATQSVAEAESKVHAGEGNAYALSLNNIAVPANTPMCPWHLTFDDPVRKFFINAFFVSWNGGNTTQSKTLEAALHTGMSVPTANFNVHPMKNLNFTSSNTPLATGYAWNGVGTGLTIANFPGLQINSLKFAPGTTHIPINGTMILGKGNSLQVVLTAAEAGLYSTIMSGWFE
jgi:hypothetical protein